MKTNKALSAEEDPTLAETEWNVGIELERWRVQGNEKKDRIFRSSWTQIAVKMLKLQCYRGRFVSGGKQKQKNF